MTKIHALLTAAAVAATTAFVPVPIAETDPVTAGEFLQVSDEREPADDWNGGDNQSVGQALGQELTGAFIRLVDDVYTFRIAAAELPAIGGTPEVTRYGWSFTYNGAAFELDGKFTNYSRGVCDPTSGQCPPPRDPGLYPFFLRGNCTTNDANITSCEELAVYEATFDPAEGTIDIDVPAADLTDDAGVQPCDTIKGSASFLGGSVWAAPTALYTLSSFPNDQVTVRQAFQVPSDDPENAPCA